MSGDEIAAALEQWRRITETATEGPWEVDTRRPNVVREPRPSIDSVGVTGHRLDVDPVFTGQVASRVRDQWEADARFIVTARTAMPALLAAVEAVLALADSANAKGTTLCDCPACITGRNNGFTGIHRPRPYMWDLDPAKIREAISSRLTTGAAPAAEEEQR